MKAIKCDRCGKIYIGGDGRNVKTIAIHKQDWDGCHSEGLGYIDLCPGCLDDLVDFLTTKEDKEDENTKEEVEHTCCCDGKKSIMNADPVKGILDEFLKADRVSPLEIHFGDQFFNHYNVKGEDEDE